MIYEACIVAGSIVLGSLAIAWAIVQCSDDDFDPRDIEDSDA